MVCKVKEPLPEEFRHFRDDLTIFTFLHLAAYPEVAAALVEAGTTGIAYETVQTPTGALTLLAPMSEVAGRMSIQIGAHFLERHNGGRGVLLGGAEYRWGPGAAFTEVSYMLMTRSRSPVGVNEAGGLSVSLGYRLQIW